MTDVAPALGAAPTQREVLLVQVAYGCPVCHTPDRIMIERPYCSQRCRKEDTMASGTERTCCASKVGQPHRDGCVNKR